MVRVDMNTNIDDVEPRVWGFFTQRQLIGLAVGAIPAALIVAYVPLDISYRLYIAVAVFAVLFICFTKKTYGMYMSQYIITITVLNIISPHERVYSLYKHDERKTEKKYKEHSKKPGYEDFLS